MFLSFRTLHLVTLVACTTCSTAFAESAPELLPPGVLAYTEISDASGLANRVLGHPLVNHVQELDQWKQATSSPKFAIAMLGLHFVELQLGTTWREALETLTSQGVGVAFDPGLQATVLISHSSDEAALQKLLQTVIRLGRSDAKNKGKEDPYQEEDYLGVTFYRTKDGYIASSGSWLMVGDKTALGQAVIDRLRDPSLPSLADQERFQQGRATIQNRWQKRRGADEATRDWPAISAYIDVGAARTLMPKQEVFSGKARDAGGEIVLGGVVEALRHVDFATFLADIGSEGLMLDLSVPHQSGTISPEREYFFGPDGRGSAPTPPLVPDTILSLCAYRNLSEMWLRASDLFDEATVDRLAAAEGNLTTLFSGRDFAEDVLASLAPGICFVAARQEFSMERPVPDIKLPAFALLLELKEPDKSWPEMRRIFQSLVGFLNVLGAMNGQPQLDLIQEDAGSMKIVSAPFVPMADADEDDPVPLQYNFSPTMAAVGSRMAIASTRKLAEQLAAPPEETSVTNGKREVVNTRVAVFASALRDALADNRGQLVSQDMLKEGHSAAEAEQQVDALLTVIGLFKQASLQLSTGSDTLSLEFALQSQGEDRDEDAR